MLQSLINHSRKYLVKEEVKIMRTFLRQNAHKLIAVLILIAVIFILRLPALEEIGRARSWALPEGWLRDLLIFVLFTAVGAALGLLSIDGPVGFRVKLSCLIPGVIGFIYSGLFVTSIYLFYTKYQSAEIIRRMEFLRILMPLAGEAASRSPFAIYAQVVVFPLCGFLLVRGLLGSRPQYKTDLPENSVGN